MAIAFKSSGAGAGTETSGAALNLVCPAVVAANDILIAHVMHTGITTNPTTPSGWTLLYPNPADITVGAPVGTGTALARHWAFGKLAVGDEDGDTISFGTGGGTNGRAGRIYSFSGYVSGSITDVVPFASFTDEATETDPAGPAVTTTVAGAMAVALMCQDDNNAHTGITGQSGGTWGDYLEFVSTALGPQGLAIAFNTCIPDADPGTVSGGSLAGANDESGTIGFEIRPSAPAFTSSGAFIAAATVAASGLLVLIGSAALAAGQPVVAGSGSMEDTATTGSGALVVTAPVVASDGLLAFAGSGALLITPPALAADGLGTFSAAGAVPVTAPSVLGLGLNLSPVLGTSSMSVAGPGIAGSGSVSVASDGGSGLGGGGAWREFKWPESRLEKPKPGRTKSKLRMGSAEWSVATPAIIGRGEVRKPEPHTGRSIVRTKAPRVDGTGTHTPEIEVLRQENTELRAIIAVLDD